MVKVFKDYFIHVLFYFMILIFFSEMVNTSFKFLMNHDRKSQLIAQEQIC